MKANTIITLLILSSGAIAKRCTYHLSGSFQKDLIIGWGGSVKLEDGLGIYPNKVLCGNGSGNNHIKRAGDGTWTIGCQPGFELKITGDGKKAIMKNGALTDEWKTGPKRSTYQCYGACEDRGPCFKCSEYDFTSDFQCQ
jgi:hypothetical protein